MSDTVKPMKSTYKCPPAQTQLGLRVIASLALMCALVPMAFAQTSSEETEIGLSAQSNEKHMAFSFQEVPVRALLQVLGETASVNIVADESIQGTLSLNLKDVTWQEALSVITHQKNLQSEQVGNTIYVRGTSSGASSAYANTNTRSGANASRAMSSGSNRQVLIEARIVEAEDSFSRSLGVKLGFNDLSRTGYTTAYQKVLDPDGSGNFIEVPIKVPTRAPSSGAIFGGNMASVQSLSGQNSNVVGLGQVPTNITNNMLNFPAAIASSGADPASFAVSLFGAGMNRFINLEISALESDGKGKIISSPRVVTSDNVRAIIEQGTEVPYQQSNALGASNTSFRKASLKLEVTPQISNNGEVSLDVDVTKDSVGVQTSQGYAINTKHVQTQVRIVNGGTLVIGGIYQEDSRNTEDKVPLLGDLPLLGHLFKSSTRSTQKTELLIFLTPYILDSHGNIVPTRADKVSIPE